MRKSILGVSIITLTLALSFCFTYADDTPADLTTVGQKVVNLQGNDTGLPSGVSEQKGTIGTILSKMFDAAGKIGNYYIKALDAANRAGSTGKILKWNGGATGNFADSLIWDTGSNIGIGALPSPVFATSNLRLDVNGNMGANQYCDENGTNCFTAAEADVTGAIIGGGGTANYITKFTAADSIGNSLLQDNGTSITTAAAINANGGVAIDGFTAISGDASEVRATRPIAGQYGLFTMYNSAGQRGAYLGWGNGGTTVDLAIDNADTLAITGGNVTMGNNLSVAGTLGVTGTVSGATPTAGTHLTTKTYVDAAITAGVAPTAVWTTSGTNIYNNNTGNIGIGTNIPGAKLTVGTNLDGTSHSTIFKTNAGNLAGTINSEIALGSIGFTTGNQSALGIRARRTAAGADWTTTALGLGMDVDNTPRASGAALWLHANGNVGVATTIPTQKLDVTGNIRASGDIHATRICTSGGTGCVNLPLTATAIDGGGTPNYVARFTDGNSLGTGALFDNGTNVGIGTTSPTTKFNVGGGRPFTVNPANGNISVQGDNGGWAFRYGAFGSGGADVGGYGFYGGGNALARYYIGTYNTDEKISILTNGNVGIDVLTPTAKFQVGSSADATLTSTTHGITIGVDTGTNLSIDNNEILARNNGTGSTLYIQHENSASNGDTVMNRYFGNVGIGTLAPTEKLDVVGNIHTTGNTFIENSSPTTYYQDTNHRSAMVHVNSNQFYVLRGDGIGSTVYEQFAGRWPLQIDLETNNATFGGTVNGKASAAASYGVIGYSQDATAYGTLGHTNAYGVYGQSAASYAVVGRTTNATYGGVLGYNSDATAWGILGHGADVSLYGNKKIISGRQGYAGTYDSTQVQGIWTIGNGYNIDTTATNDFGAQYGIVYAHTNAGTAAMGGKKPLAGQGHQILFTGGGITKAMISLGTGNSEFNMVNTTCVGNCF